MTQPFQFANGQVAHSKEDLLRLCQQNPDDATNYLLKEDLEKWLAYIGDYELAECATNARQTDVADRQKLEEFLNRSYSLTAPKPAPPAVPDVAPVVENLPKAEAKVEAKQNSAPAVGSEKSTTATAEPKATATPSLKAPKSSNSTTNSEKLSFFQVIAKFIVNILYRNKK